MRPGPTTDQLAGEVTIDWNLAVMRGKWTIASHVPSWGVVLEETNSRTVPAQLTFTAPAEWMPHYPLDALNNYGQRVQCVQRLIVEGQPDSIELGWYQIDEWAEQDDGNVKVTALDMLKRPDESPLTWPSSPEAGATLRTEFQRMAGDLPVILDPGVVDRPVPRTTQYGTSRTDNMRDLAASYGVEYGVKPDGYLHLWKPRTGRDPVAYYTGRDLGTPGYRSGRLLSAPRKSQDRRPNVWTVVGGQSSGDRDQRWSATVRSTEPPFEPEGYGIVTDRREMNTATGQGQVTAAAQTYQRHAMMTSETRSLEIPADPRLERGDIISVTTKSGEVIVGRIIAYSLPVSDHKATMRVDVEVLQW